MKKTEQGTKDGPRRERRAWTAEFKQEAVRLLHERRMAGTSVAEVARSLDVRPEQLRQWAKQGRYAGSGDGLGVVETPAQERKRLRRENAELRKEREFAKKSSGVLRDGVAVRYAFLAQCIGEYSVRLMCRVLRLTPSGYYAWRKRPWLERRLADELLALHTMDMFLRSRETYGSPRVHAELQGAGLPVSRERVARVMRDDALVARRPGRRVSTTNSAHAEPIAPNVVARAFAVAANPTVDRVWVGDITYVPTATGWLYLAVVLDLASRRCIGWAMRDSLETDVVDGALAMALAARHPAPGLIFHSDRGVQYASVAYRARLAAHGIVASMSRKGHCWDNAVAESFFATLEHELFAREEWATHAEARRAIFTFIETWYNRDRRHSSLGYVSPSEYEATLRARAAVTQRAA